MNDHCDHCDHIRTRVTEAWGETLATGFQASKPPPRAVQSPEYASLVRVDPTMYDCRCRCHTPARIAGTLPRLKDAS